MTPQTSQPYGPPVQTRVLVEAPRCSTGHVIIAWLLTVITGFYLLPWAIAATRGRRNVAAVALVDLLLGWTVVGWVVALVMACGSDRPVVVVQHTYAPWAPVPPPPPPAAPAWPAPPARQVPAVPAAYEPTVVDPLGSAPTQVLARPLPTWTGSHDQH